MWKLNMYVYIMYIVHLILRNIHYKENPFYRRNKDVAIITVSLRRT